MSSRAKRGICFFANPKKKADSSGKPRHRKNTFGIFPQPVQPCRKVRKNKVASAAALYKIELPHRFFSLWVFVLVCTKTRRLKPAPLTPLNARRLNSVVSRTDLTIFGTNR